MLNQRRCPCCVNGKPEYRQYLSSRTTKPPRCQEVLQRDRNDDEFTDGKEDTPYAYLGDGEIWANRAFLKLLQKKYNQPYCQCPHNYIANKTEISLSTQICIAFKEENSDLIIETRDHKYLKVVGPGDCNDGEEFFVLIDPGRRRKQSSSSNDSS
ncbi:unnamed protein product [Mesocestoides corti]|uniref:Uncharacterized protein n=1 Tax=Mesocestoides corti TaxID=53468 RepID=A0A0R3UJD6_MESCO|nr:unnamed protein product [Mesocestoides corti]